MLHSLLIVLDQSVLEVAARMLHYRVTFAWRMELGTGSGGIFGSNCPWLRLRLELKVVYMLSLGEQ